MNQIVSCNLRSIRTHDFAACRMEPSQDFEIATEGALQQSGALDRLCSYPTFVGHALNLTSCMPWETCCVVVPPIWKTCCVVVPPVMHQTLALGNHYFEIPLLTVSALDHEAAVRRGILWTAAGSLGIVYICDI